jgi:hypothetical protein
MIITWLIERFVRFYLLRNGLIISERFTQETQINRYNAVILYDISKKLWHLSRYQFNNGLKLLIATGSIFRQRKK